MRYQNLLFSLLIALFAGSACDRNAPTTSPEPPTELQGEATVEEVEEVVAGDIERSLLWHVEGPNGPMWLFGTIHAGVDASVFEGLPADLQEALDQAQTVVLEVDIDDLQSPALMQQMFIPPGEPTLQAQLGPERWAAFVELSPLPAALAESMQPWVAYSLVLQGMIGDEEPVDESIKRFGQERGAQIEYVETIEEQLHYLSQAITIDVLGDILDDPDEYGEQLAQMFSIYRRGDVQALEEVVFDEEEMENHPEMIDLLLTQRNHNWVPRLLEYLERGNVFVAVGAGHLIGEEGLIELLTAEGHAVERVPAQ